MKLYLQNSSGRGGDTDDAINRDIGPGGHDLQMIIQQLEMNEAGG
jgi:hypothetical protein